MAAQLRAKKGAFARAQEVDDPQNAFLSHYYNSTSFGVAAAGLDVYEDEPLPADHELRRFPNVTLTPHLGASTAEAQESVGLEIAEAIVDALRGGIIRNAVNVPSIDTRTLTTRVMVGDGQTVVLGGILETDRRESEKKVPYLGDIPILGYLFQEKLNARTKRNLLIFITAKTVTSDGAAPEEVFDPRAIKAIGLTHDDLPGNRAVKGTDLFAPAPATEKQP